MKNEKNKKTKGFDVNTIAEITGLTTKKIENM
jgi:hypothetical protein